MSKSNALEVLVGSGSIEFNDKLGIFAITSVSGTEAEIRLDYGDRVEDYTITLEEK